MQVLLDESQKSERYTVADTLAHAGIAVTYDTRAKISHSKVMIIDGQTVVTGSFNFTKSAEESNAENLLIIADAALAARYAEHWRSRRVGAEPYAGRLAARPAFTRRSVLQASPTAGRFNRPVSGFRRGPRRRLPGKCRGGQGGGRRMVGAC